MRLSKSGDIVRASEGLLPKFVPCEVGKVAGSSTTSFKPKTASSQTEGLVLSKLIIQAAIPANPKRCPACATQGTQVLAIMPTIDDGRQPRPEGASSVSLGRRGMVSLSEQMPHALRIESEKSSSLPNSKACLESATNGAQESTVKPLVHNDCQPRPEGASYVSLGRRGIVSLSEQMPRRPRIETETEKDQGAERPGDYRRNKTPIVCAIKTTQGLLCSLLFALTLVGCGGKKDAPNAPDSNKPSPNEASNKPPSEFANQALATGPGKASRSIRYWDIEWQSANLGRGWMRGTKGIIYQDGRPMYSFEAELATSSDKHNRLILSDKFKVLKVADQSPVASTEGQAKIEWNPETSKFRPTRGTWVLDDSRQGPDRASRMAHLWDIEWQSANLVIKQVDTPSGETKSKQFGTMRAAKGVVYKDGQIASTFQTDLAEAFEADDRLKLSGKVVLTAFVIDNKDKAKKTTVLTANEVSWDPLTQRYTASGNVEVDGPNGYLAPTDKVFASAKLDRIATSEDYFKK